MANKKNTRRALFSSVIALILCFSMLMGTTFAWFTDSVTSGMNQITAGNLDVELYHSDKAEQNKPVATDTKLFDDITLWEPGAVVYENLQVKNVGNLALKYQMALTFTNATKSPKNSRTLADVLKVAVVRGGFTGDREAAKALNFDQTLSTFALTGDLREGQSSETYGVVIYWQPGANDNDFNMNNDVQGKNIMKIDLGINLFATQLEHENDSFDNTYDEDAKLEMPEVKVETPTADAFLAALAKGETAVLTGDMTLETDGEVPAGVTSAIDLNGHTLTLGTNGIAVKGGLIVTNGTVAAVAGEDDLSFAFTVSNGGALEIESDATISVSESGSGAVLMYSGDLDVNGTINTASDAYGVFAMGSNIDIDVNGAITGEGIAINQQGGTTDVTVEGTLGNSVLGASGTMNLTYTGEMPVVKDDGTDVTLNTKTTAEISSKDELTSTLKKSLANGDKEIKLDANGADIGDLNYAFGGSGTIVPEGTTVTISNAVVPNRSYGNMVNGTVVFENCDFTAGLYSIHFADDNGNATGTGKVIFKECNLIGWNSFGTGLDSVEMYDCTLKDNGTYGFIRAYMDLYMENCYIDVTSANTEDAYPEGIEVTEGNELTMINCTEVLADGVSQNGNTYSISNANGLKWFANSVNVNKNNYSGKTVKLVDDIDLNNELWTPIGQTGATEFRGIFDGQNHTISNLNVDSSAQTGGTYSSGLFGWAESGVTIQNVKVDGATVVGNHNVAVIVGYTYSGKITNCHVSNAAITCKHANNDACGDKCGLIAGYAADESRITDCSASNSSVTAGRDAGQLIGTGYNVSVSNCTASNVTVTAGGDCTGANVRAEIIGRVMG